MENNQKYYNKKKVLHIANKNALGGGIGTVINYLREGINQSDEFHADSLFTTYNHKNHRPGKTKFAKGLNQEKNISEGELEDLIGNYDVIHVHGIPHYGILEHLQKIKKKKGKIPKIVNTAHSSVKQEFLAQYENAQKNSEEELKKDFKELKYLKDNNVLKNPSPFADTYWGSAIYRQEQIMSLADSVQHMNEAYKKEIIEEYAASENEEKHKIIPNGVKVINNYKERPKKKRLLFVGRFAKDKGIDELIDSLPLILEKHPDAEIRLVGGDKSGKLVNKYKEKTKKLIQDHFKGKSTEEINKYLSKIDFTGWVTDKNKLHEHYQWTDYVLIPSKAESFSLSASEALMHKRIPVMTKTKALDDLYISKGIGLGIHPDKRHGEGIAEAIDNILKKDHSEEYDNLTEKGRKFVIENYSFEKMIENQLKSYRELIMNKKEENGSTKHDHNN